MDEGSKRGVVFRLRRAFSGSKLRLHGLGEEWPGPTGITFRAARGHISHRCHEKLCYIIFNRGSGKMIQVEMRNPCPLRLLESGAAWELYFARQFFHNVELIYAYCISLSASAFLFCQWNCGGYDQRKSYGGACNGADSARKRTSFLPVLQPLPP